MTVIDDTSIATDIEPGAKPDGSPAREPDWHKSACILCECNCGVEIRLGADGHTQKHLRQQDIPEHRKICDCRAPGHRHHQPERLERFER